MTQPPEPPSGWPYPVQPKEPRAVTAMILGIVGVAGGFVCYLPILVSPVALVLGKKSLNAIRQQPHLAGQGEAMAGFVLGIIGTCILSVLLLAAGAVAAWALFDTAGFSEFWTD